MGQFSSLELVSTARGRETGKLGTLLNEVQANHNSQMPTKLGKAIEKARSENSKAFKTTFSREKDVQKMQKIADSLDDKFTTEDLAKIVGAVKTMLP